MRWLHWIVGVLLWAGPLLAQEMSFAKPSLVSEKDKSTAMQWLMLAVFLVACLVVAFKPAKRSKLE